LNGFVVLDGMCGGEEKEKKKRGEGGGGGQIIKYFQILAKSFKESTENE